MPTADSRLNEHDPVCNNFHTDENTTRCTNTTVEEQLLVANTTVISNIVHYHSLSKTNFNASKSALIDENSAVKEQPSVANNRATVEENMNQNQINSFPNYSNIAY